MRFPRLPFLSRLALARSLACLPPLMALLIFSVSVLVLIGWWCGSESLVCMQQNGHPMIVDAALGFLLCSIGLWFESQKRLQCARILGALVVALACLHLGAI